jgi:hypothetical protein
MPADTVRVKPSSRRDLLRRAAAGSAGLAAASALAPSAFAGGSRQRRPGKAQRFYDDEDLNFEALFAYGSAAYGAAEFGEVATITNRVNRRGATYDAVYDEFTAYGDRLRHKAEEALAAGHTVTARSRFLRSAQCINQALFFVLGTSQPGRERATYGSMNDSFTRAAALFDPPFERVEIPYENTTMPGWLLTPDASGQARPTLIVNNGSDAQLIDIWSYGGAAAIARGWNALLFEGPGQGAMLFERGIPFRPDWESVVTPVVDFLLARSDVEPDRIAISGWSMGGELVARAAAFEHRLAAIVLDPGATDVLAAWNLPKVLVELVDAGKRKEVDEGFAEYIQGATPQQKFELAKRSEIFRAPDYYTLIKDLQRYTNVDVVPSITSPTLVTEYELEEFFPGQARELYDLLTAPKALVGFTVAQGAQYHDAPMAPQWRNEVVFDWLEETLGAGV